MTIEENKNNVYQAVKAACEKANRSSDEVNIIAVTKYVSSDIAEELVKTGIKHIAENRVDKFLDKYQALNNYDLTWHLIGTLQRRKVKDVINLVDYFHALDSVKLAEEIQKRANHTIKCFLQVNVSGEESKHGFSPEELDTVLDQIKNRTEINLMALKDTIDKIVSYFDTDEVTDYEDAAKEEEKKRPVKAQRPVQTQPRQQRQPERSQATVPPRRQHVNADLQETQVLRSLPLSRSQANQGPHQMSTTKTTIAIKYPKKYEDAQEIVELLIENECVLIDFQYMLEAQARRCLDFIDGASKVLTGNLQKVGSSMYLLTPINVVVDIEEIGLAHGNQEANFDFDMKRR